MRHLNSRHRNLDIQYTTSTQHQNISSMAQDNTKAASRLPMTLRHILQRLYNNLVHVHTRISVGSKGDMQERGGRESSSLDHSRPAPFSFCRRVDTSQRSSQGSPPQRLCDSSRTGGLEVGSRPQQRRRGEARSMTPKAFRPVVGAAGRGGSEERGDRIHRI